MMKRPQDWSGGAYLKGNTNDSDRYLPTATLVELLS